MSDEQYLNALLASQGEYQRRIRVIENDLRREDEPLEKDSKEAAIQLEDEEVLKGLLVEAEHELDRVNKALVRINEGSFGVCLRCGGDIDPARLSVMPQAEYCLECADRHR